MRRALACAVAMTGAWLTTGPAAAATHRVPDDYATATAALAASSPGDSVTLAPGTYAESVSLPPGVTLVGLGAPGSVTLQAPGAGTVVDAVNPVAGTRVVGLVLSGGSGVNDGGLTEGGNLRAVGGQLEVDDCTFTGGQAAFGGGTAGIGTALVFRRCTWSGGSASYGGGHFQAAGTLTLDGGTFQGGTAGSGGGLFADGGTQVTVMGTAFAGCQATGDGGGAWLDQAVATFSNARFDGTGAGGHGGGLALAAGAQVLASATAWLDVQSGLGGGAFWVSCAAGSPGARTKVAPGRGATVELVACALLSLTHCDIVKATGAAPAAGGVTDAAEVDVQTSIVAGNASGLACLDPRATLAVTCSDLYQNGGADVSGLCTPAPGANLLAVDPYLCDLAGRDLGLCANSPLLSPPACDAYWGVAGQACAACGPTPTRPATWGQLKARYRE